MGWIAAAAGISAAGGLASGMMGSSASKAAAGQAQQASREATQLNTNIYNQTRGDLQPWVGAGRHALDWIVGGLPWSSSPTDLSNLDTSQLNLDQAALERTPGYQFTRDQGLKSVQNSAAARGLGSSGAALKGAANFATGLADNTWQNVFKSKLDTFNAGLAADNADMANKSSTVNRLLSIANLGENAAVQSGTIGGSTAASAGNALMAGGSAAAAGTTGSASALAGGVNGVGNSAMNYLMMSKLFGPGNGPPGGETGSWDAY